MRKSLIFVTVLLSVLLFALPVFAQDTPPDLCDPAQGMAAIESVLGALDTSSQEAYLNGVVSVRTVLTIIDQTCLGLGYSSEADGLQPVIGPVIIPAGVYRLTFTTAGFGTVEIEPIEGECSADGFSTLVFNASAGEANDGAQSVFTSGRCMALISVSNTSEAWTLDFEALGISGN